MLHRRLVYLIVGLLTLLLLAGCASGPKYAEVADSFTSLDPAQGRIYIYRTTALGAAVQPQVLLDGNVVGKAVPKGFFFVDVEPGAHKILTSTEVDRTLSLVVDEGQTRYVRLNIGIGFFVGHVYPELVEPDVGAAEIRDLSYTGTP